MSQLLQQRRYLLGAAAIIVAIIVVLVVQSGGDDEDGEPTAAPTATPTATEEPTAEATATEEPTAEATATEEPTAEATEEPTAEATEEPTAEATEEPTAEPTTEETGAADFGVVKVGMNAEYSPMEYVDENGDIVGFDVDLVKLLAERAGFEYELINTRWDTIFVALAAGDFDIVASSATITEEREETVDFTNPYFNAGQMIAVKADRADEITTPEDLAGLKVGVQQGTTGDIYASEQIEGADVVRYDEITMAFQALGTDEVDAVLNDGPVSADYIAKNPELEAVLVGIPLTEEFYGIAVQPDQPELLDAINAALADIIADGSYAELYVKWFGVEPDAMFMPPAE